MNHQLLITSPIRKGLSKGEDSVLQAPNMSLIGERPLLELTGAQRQVFNEVGFLAIDGITSLEEIEMLREVFGRLFAEKTGREQGAQFDMVGHDDDGNAQPARSPQIVNPQIFASELNRTLFAANALAVGRALLGSRAEIRYQHAICNLAGGYGARRPGIRMKLFDATLHPAIKRLAFGCHYRRSVRKIAAWNFCAALIED